MLVVVTGTFSKTLNTMMMSILCKINREMLDVLTVVMSLSGVWFGTFLLVHVRTV